RARGTAFGSGAPGPDADPARRGGPRGRRDRPLSGAISGNPAALVHPLGPSPRADSGGGRRADSLRLRSENLASGCVSEHVLPGPRKRGDAVRGATDYSENRGGSRGGGRPIHLRRAALGRQQSGDRDGLRGTASRVPRTVSGLTIRDP